MKTYRISNTDLVVSRIALGCMSMAGSWVPNLPVDEPVTARARTIVDAALELGINFFDHADIYCSGRSETAFGNVLRERPALRDKIVLQTKCGIRFGGEPDSSAPQRYDFSYEHIVKSVEKSLKRMATDRIDILLLHRPDPLVEPAEVARAFDELHAAGKVRYFGVSNHSPAQMELLRPALRQPIIANQLQLSLLHHYLINEGVTVNQTAGSFTGAVGLLEYCRLNNILVQAWSPTAQGRLANAAGNASDRELRICSVVQAIAKQRNVPADAIVLAWLLRHPAGIQPIVGTTNPQHLRDDCAADGVDLTREEWWRLFVASRGGTLP